jgi:two-component system chemotaxis response regulator CheB
VAQSASTGTLINTANGLLFMPIRVLIVEDSPVQRLALARLVESSPDLIVCGLAVDGEQAVQMTERLRPDVISMDVQMPRLNGLDATRQIMNVCPTPIVVVSAVSTSPAALDALQAGALAVIEKPPGPHAPDYETRSTEIIQLLKLMADVQVIRHRPPEPVAIPPYAIPAVSVPFVPNHHPLPVIVGIGASAGGPGALSRLLGSLPPDFPLPIVIVQHLPGDFVPGLADWLDRICRLNVRLAAAGDLPLRGNVYIAPGNRHLRIGTDRRLVLDSPIGNYRHCPAVDVLFESMAEIYGAHALGIILTGMGDDGAAGLRIMRDNGGHTIAQDESSCVVFGMPAAAIARGAAELILPLSEIGMAMQRLVGYSNDKNSVNSV